MISNLISEEFLDLPDSFAQTKLKSSYESQTTEMMDIYANDIDTVQYWESALIDKNDLVSTNTGAVRLAGCASADFAIAKEQAVHQPYLAQATEVFFDGEMSYEPQADDCVAQATDVEISLDDTDIFKTASGCITDNNNSTNNLKQIYNLDEILGPLVKHAFLPGIAHLTTIVARPVYNTRFDNDLVELQEATAAFLADQYDNGEYVATANDIADLEEATAAFLAERHDGECFCLDEAAPGLLLPGEHFFLQTSTAVDIARPKYDVTQDVIDMIDECLDAQTSLEDMSDTSDTSDTPPLDTARQGIELPKLEYTFFDDILDLKPVPDTLQLGECYDHSLVYECPHVALDDCVDSHNNVHQQVNIYVDDGEGDNISETVTDNSDTAAYDAPDALSLLQASYATSFFDPNTEVLVCYTSFNQLLTMGDEDNDKLLHCVHQAPNVTDEIDLDNDHGVAELGEEGADSYGDASVGLDNFYFSWDEPFEPAAQQVVKRGPLKTMTQLATIFEEDKDLCSPASDSSIDSANHHGFLKTQPVQCKEFLKDKEFASLPSDPITTADVAGSMALPIKGLDPLNVDDPYEASAASGASEMLINKAHHDGVMQPDLPYRIDMLHKEEAERFEEMFSDDLWNNELDLQLSFSISPQPLVAELLTAELGIFEVLHAVLNIARTRYCSDLPQFGADLQQKLLALLNVLTEYLEEFKNFTVDRMVAVDAVRPDSVVS